MQDYTGNPTAAQSPSPAPGPGVALVVALSEDGIDAINFANFAQRSKAAADFITWLMSRAGNSQVGDGSDGALTFDGTSTVAGLVPSGGIYTMTRNLYATTLLVTGASTVLKTAGFIPFATISITTASGGSISNDGANASGSTPGGTGGAGATSPPQAGGNATNQSNTLSATAGKGGAGGTDGTNAGGSAGTLTPLSDTSLVHIYQPSTLGWVFLNGTWTEIVAASGGGGGAAEGAGSVGGGGGGPAGVLMLATRTLTLASAGDIHCTGGTGAAGVHTAGSAGGGGGGGGGTLIAAYVTCNQTLSAAVNCAGGAGGAGAGTGGAAGTIGANGNVVTIQLGI